MTSQSFLMPSPFAVWTAIKPLLISASAEPCWCESDHHRFASVDGGFMTGLTSTVGWITISLEGGP